jgi:hypothetical protein
VGIAIRNPDLQIERSVVLHDARYWSSDVTAIGLAA